MKKLTTILGSTLLVAAFIVPVLGWGHGWGRGHHMMGDWGSAPAYCSEYGRAYEALTPEQLDRKFYNETADLRNEIWRKSGELDTLLNSSDPNIEKVKALQKEISGLRVKLDEKRLNYELEARKISPEQRFSRGHGRGYGHYMGGFGPGVAHSPLSCWD